eukprot:TRINITY_DN11343_c0_g2_i8.p5 TRINITY_DN11343_c0_g2~~TRINITY_DN11343_c0_g2_i8.p5  ORF type:complete len:112 (-),score=10.49 TRINITY_DN11343_c0_g2_i8:575-910(-)
MQRKVVKVLRLQNKSVWEQLQIEEAIYRVGSGNWCVFNHGINSPPVIVMGISGKPQEWLHVQNVQNTNVQVLKRFTGGGTVIVDHNTLMVSLICQFRSEYLLWDRRILYQV